MRLLLDSNVWRYIVDHGAENQLERAAIQSGAQIVVAPVLVLEARDLKDAAVREKLLVTLSNPCWTRLMPDAYLEALEIKDVIRRLRKEWVIDDPDLSHVTTLRTDWELVEGGFWSRAHNDIAPPVTDEGLRSGAEHALARQETHTIRNSVLKDKQTLPANFSLQHVYGVPPAPWEGWRGAPVEYWRVPSLYHLRSELEVYTSPYREWLDSEIDISAMKASPKSVTELWLYEIAATDAPRQWLRGAFEFLQAFSKVTPGSPVDAQISSHLVDVDIFVSADRNFYRFTEKFRADAPFRVAQGHLLPGGKKGVEDLLALVEHS